VGGRPKGLMCKEKNGVKHETRPKKKRKATYRKKKRRLGGGGTKRRQNNLGAKKGSQNLKGNPGQRGIDTKIRQVKRAKVKGKKSSTREFTT